MCPFPFLFFFFFKDTATPEIYTLSLHDALPICSGLASATAAEQIRKRDAGGENLLRRSEEHTSELQSRYNIVCRLLLEKKKRLAPSFRAGWLVYCTRRPSPCVRSS